MLKLPKFKSFFIALFVLLFFGLGLSATLAQEQEVFTSQEEFESALTDQGFNKQQFDFHSLLNPAAGANVVFHGCGDPNCPEDLRSGLIQKTGVAIAYLYTPPASSIQYVEYALNNLNPVNPAYAQGFGFSQLNPILNIWKAFRNIAYVFFVFIFVIMGFAIMFRMKISPQAAVTIQSAIPRLVVALLLVTFSYAIAGLIIDLSYTLGIIFLRILTTAGNFQQNATDVEQHYINGTFPGVAGTFVSSWWHGFDNVMEFFTPAITPAMQNLFSNLSGGAFISVIGRILGGIGGGAIGIVINLLIGFALFVSLVRIFFTLLMSYIAIIVSIIFGPIQLMLDALPFETGFGAGTWFRNLIANTFIFPITAILLVVAVELINQVETHQAFWSPPLLFGTESDVIPAFIGLGMLIFMGQILNQIKAALKAVTGAAFVDQATGLVGGAGTAVGEENIRGLVEAGQNIPRVGGAFRSLYRMGQRARRWQ